jgi:hypothetical protein
LQDSATLGTTYDDDEISEYDANDDADDDRICGFGHQRELSSSPLTIAQNCNAARDKIKAC